MLSAFCHQTYKPAYFCLLAFLSPSCPDGKGTRPLILCRVDRSSKTALKPVLCHRATCVYTLTTLQALVPAVPLPRSFFSNLPNPFLPFLYLMFT